MFERYGPAAEQSGSAMLTAFGYDWVPGNLAGGIALRRAGEDAVRVDIGYFITGKASASGGTWPPASARVGEPSFGFRDGRVQTERGAKRVRAFQVGSKRRDAVSVGSSEHFTLPRIAPQLREVNAYLGWFGPLSRPMQVMSLGMTLPGMASVVKARRRALREGLHRRSRRRGARRGRTRTSSRSPTTRLVGELAEVHVTGVDGYTFTGRILAWGAQRAAEGGDSGDRALGPVDGFGLVALTDGCRWAGLEEKGGPQEASGLAAGACGSQLTRPRGGGWRCWSAVALLALGVGDRGRSGRRGRTAPHRVDAATAAGRGARGGRPPQPAPAGRPADDLQLPGHLAPGVHPSAPARGRDRRRDPVRAQRRGPAQWQRLTRALQRNAHNGALVMVDQEGGEIRTVGWAGPVAGQPFQGQPAEVRRAARSAARQLRTAGVNVNLAPVADVPTGGAALALARVRGRREGVADRTRASIEGMWSARLAATAKHFPGLGRAAREHRRRHGRIGGDVSADLVPFRAAIDAGVPLVMLSHAVYPRLDPRRIASQSPPS